MAAVELGEAQVQPLLADEHGRLVIAASNSPASVTIAGETAALDRLLARLDEAGVSHRRLAVDYAFHSPQMEPFRTELVRALDGITPRPPTLTLCSTVTGRSYEAGSRYDAAYWGENMCSTVRFAPAIAELACEGYRTFVEISPHPVLARSVRQCLERQQAGGTVLPSLRQGADECMAMLESLARLYTLGFGVDWRQLYAQPAGASRVVHLPASPWQRRRFWLDFDPETRRPRTPAAAIRTAAQAPRHPLLAEPIRTARGETIFETLVGPEHPAWLGDHHVHGAVVFPAAACVEMVLAAATQVFGSGMALQIEDLLILQALVLQPPRLAQLLLGRPTEAGDVVPVELYSRPAGGAVEEDAWVLHLTARVRREASAAGAADLLAGVDLQAVQARCDEPMDGSMHYHHMAKVGLAYGPAFRGVQRIWRRDGEALGEVALPDHLAGSAAPFHLHPAVLDACLQVVEACLPQNHERAEQAVYLPLSIDRFRFHSRPGKTLWSHVVAQPDRLAAMRATEVAAVDLRLLSESGALVAEIDGLHLKRAPKAALMRAPATRQADMLYEVTWQLAPRVARTGAIDGETAALRELGSWLIFCDRDGAGEHSVLVHAGGYYSAEQPDRVQIDPRKPSHFVRLLSETFHGLEHLCHGIVYLWGLNAAPAALPEIDAHMLMSDQAISCGSVVSLVQALTSADWLYAPRLWIVTRGSQAFSRDTLVAPEQAPVWGLGGVVALEQPDLGCTRVDLDPAEPAGGQAEALLVEILDPDDEDQIALRQRERYVARLAPSSLPPLAIAGSAGLRLRADATYLITGGLGGLGLATAQWMVEQKGAQHLVLCGRRSPDSAQRSAVARLEQMGAHVVLVAVDVADEQQVAELIATIQRDMPPLRGVIHAAGVLDDGILIQQSWDRFARVFMPKVAGSWNLHRHTRRLDLDLWVLFSSGAALLGSPGQANYAAANAFMDALAHSRRGQGQPALSINWGAWADVGMVTQNAAIQRRLARDGMRPINVDEGLLALEHLVRHGATQVAVLPVDWATFAAHAPAGMKLPFLAQLRMAAGSSSGPARSSGDQLEQELLRLVADAGPARAEDGVRAFVRAQVTQVLGLDESFVLEPSVNLFDLGMDSLMAVELRNRLQIATSQSLPGTVVFDHPTVADLVKYLGTAVEAAVPVNAA